MSVAIFFNQWSVESALAGSAKIDEPVHKDHLMVRTMVELAEVRPGQWHCVMPLSPGWYEYLFVVDGAWVMDPNAPEICPDGVGGFNSARMVESAAVSRRGSRPMAHASDGGRRRGISREIRRDSMAVAPGGRRAMA